MYRIVAGRAVEKKKALKILTLTGFKKSIMRLAVP